MLFTTDNVVWRTRHMRVPTRQYKHDAVCDVITSQTRALKNVTRMCMLIEVEYYADQ